ncbi:Os07g0262300 [Oryza sativa Japonica Group]|uniref:Os07g0262300 protein n=1 Tax=Oryza sativa subsp. japonica TaxID=39947 RepID=A0A0P0X4V5_ORYSJ|nr:Os07g0262300 [Oryza sativa Japonica Group]
MDSRSRVDALVRRNRTPVTPSPFPPSLAAGCRRHNPPPSHSLRRIRAVSSSPLVPRYLPVCSPSPASPYIAPPLAAAIRRPFAAASSSSSRRSAWQPRRRQLGQDRVKQTTAPRSPSPRSRARSTASREAARGPAASASHREPRAPSPLQGTRPLPVELLLIQVYHLITSQ